MDITSFRIVNYRSIKDSGECHLSGDNITILAGKNESGKTAILEALQDFDFDRPIREEAIPLNQPDSKPATTITFSLHQETLSEIGKEISLNLAVKGPSFITITKTYPNAYSYLPSQALQTALTQAVDNQSTDTKQKALELYTQISNLLYTSPQIKDSPPNLDFSNLPSTIAQLVAYTKSVSPKLSDIPDVSRREALAHALQDIVALLNNGIKDSDAIGRNFNARLRSRIPNFILFSSFEDVFPSEIALTQAPSNQLVKDLDIISNLNLGIITKSSTPLKKRHKEQLNIKIQEDYKAFWTQDLTNLSIDWDSNNLQFFISENGYYYPPKMRSKGKQWHLSFYVRVTARAREGVPNVILIDEPGLYLHAQAQKDIMKKLEDCAKHAPIIFSTHSPYLIDTNKLSRIRLVLKPPTDEGTIISNKIHKTADIETLTPIITAIGLDLSLGLDIAKDNNIIFEGITDYYYVFAFTKILRFDFPQEVHFIPGAGADKINLLISLMIGWGLNYCVVLDNDSKGIYVYNQLQKDFRSTNIKIQFISQDKDKEIEDLFSKEDFLKHVLKEKLEDLPADRSNSQMIKQGANKQDKVLLAKSFYEKATTERLKLTPETEGNFKNLLERIKKAIFSGQ